MKSNLIINLIIMFCFMIFNPISLSAVRTVDHISNQSILTTGNQQQINDGGILRGIKNWVKKFKTADKEERKKLLINLILKISLVLLIAYVLGFALAFLAILLGLAGSSAALSGLVLILSIVIPTIICVVFISKFFRKYYEKIGKDVKRQNIILHTLLVIIGANFLLFGLNLLINSFV